MGGVLCENVKKDGLNEKMRTTAINMQLLNNEVLHHCA